QMSLVRASHKQIDALLDEIGIDEELAALLQLYTARGIPFHIVSDGFDYCIRRILSAAGKKLAALLRGGRVCAAHLESRGRVWHTEFPFFHRACGHGCATCKPGVMRLLNWTKAPTSCSQRTHSMNIATNNPSNIFLTKTWRTWPLILIDLIDRPEECLC